MIPTDQLPVFKWNAPGGRKGGEEGGGGGITAGRYGTYVAVCGRINRWGKVEEES